MCDRLLDEKSGKLFYTVKVIFSINNQFFIFQNMLSRAITPMLVFSVNVTGKCMLRFTAVMSQVSVCYDLQQ